MCTHQNDLRKLTSMTKPQSTEETILENGQISHDTSLSWGNMFMILERWNDLSHFKENLYKTLEPGSPIVLSPKNYIVIIPSLQGFSLQVAVDVFQESRSNKLVFREICGRLLHGNTSVDTRKKWYFSDMNCNCQFIMGAVKEERTHSFTKGKNVKACCGAGHNTNPKPQVFPNPQTMTKQDRLGHGQKSRLWSGHRLLIWR